MGTAWLLSSIDTSFTASSKFRAIGEVTCDELWVHLLLLFTAPHSLIGLDSPLSFPQAWKEHWRFLNEQASILAKGFQRLLLGKQARALLRQLKQEKAYQLLLHRCATLIQTQIRGALARIHYHRSYEAIIAVRWIVHSYCLARSIKASTICLCAVCVPFVLRCILAVSLLPLRCGDYCRSNGAIEATLFGRTF